MYKALLNNLTTAQKNLDDFTDKYPNLQVATVFPKDIVSGIINRLAKEYREQLFIDNSYLDDDERTDGIQVGSHAPVNSGYKHNRVNRRIKQEEQALVADIKDKVELHAIYLTALYLEKSQVTAKYTAKRIDELQRLTREVFFAKKALQEHNIDQCTKFFVMNDVDKFYYIVDAKTAPEESGFYFLLVHGHILYIGHSRNLRERLRNNDIVRKYYLQGDYDDIDCVYVPCSIERAKELERTLIAVAKPPYNKRGKNL